MQRNTRSWILWASSIALLQSAQGVSCSFGIDHDLPKDCSWTRVPKCCSNYGSWSRWNNVINDCKQGIFTCIFYSKPSVRPSSMKISLPRILMCVWLNCLLVKLLKASKLCAVVLLPMKIWKKVKSFTLNLLLFLVFIHHSRYAIMLCGKDIELT